MKLRSILEMPHTEYINNSQFGLVDFRVEKYNLPKDQIHNLILSFYKTGFVGFSKLTNTWLLFNNLEARNATQDEIEQLPHLADDWEDHLFNIREPV